jgi:hypothetical protein
MRHKGKDSDQMISDQRNDYRADQKSSDRKNLK